MIIGNYLINEIGMLKCLKCGTTTWYFQHVCRTNNELINVPPFIYQLSELTYQIWLESTKKINE